MTAALIKVIIIPLILLSLVGCRSQYRAVENACNSTSCTFKLAYFGTDEYYKTPKSPIIKNLIVVFSSLTFSDFAIKIYDSQNTNRFQVPQGNGFPQDPYRNFTFPFQNAGFTFSYTLDPFDFRFARKVNNYTFFSTYDQDFIFSDYYIQFGTEIQNDFIYGLGQRFVSSFRVKDGKWTMWNKDHPFEIDQGTGQQTYGYYPYYMNREKANFFHLTYFRSSNAMDVIKETVQGRTSLTFKVIGGIIDLRFMIGERDPLETLLRMTQYGGVSNIPPFWSLGFHQCRWGYEDSKMLLDVLANYQKYGIPLDTIWSDIDYMQDFQDFTIDEQNFPLSDMKKIKENYRYIPIIDAGIMVDGVAYDEGLKRGVFVKDALGKLFVGAVWPGDTTFVDFFHPNASQYWGDMLDLLYQKIQFDGVWLDMNELSNFCNGPCKTPTTQKVFDYTNDLPYHPGNSKIEDATISLNCTHYLGYKQADVHNLHAYLQTKATNQFLKSKNKRPFIISRSSTIGSSRYGNHWTGDNGATWQFLQGSISNIFNSHLNGFKIVGQDICGFGGNTTVELCARWYQLGSLYPFARSHNAYGAQSQEPYALGEIVLQAATKAIKLRYSLLKYLYTFIVLYDDSLIWVPLFFVYPNHDKLYSDQIADTTFLLTDSILVAPILEEGQVSRSVYFPQVNWYDLFSGKRYKANETSIVYSELTDTLPLFISEGFTLLLQNTDYVRNTKQLDNIFTSYSGFKLSQKIGEKQIYISNGIILSFDDYNNNSKIDSCINIRNCYYIISMTLTVDSIQSVLSITPITKSSMTDELFIEELNIYFEDRVLNYKPEKFISISKNGDETVIVLEHKGANEINLEHGVNLKVQ